jgi:DNA-binding NtrC family response regulator/tetratricopeptide (TPR) repeat protein
MRLLADRFLGDGSGPAIDLATTEPVTLRLDSTAGDANERRWMARCDMLHKLRHPAMAPLVDYGALGETTTFEAWGCGERWSGSRAREEAIKGLAGSFLRACALTDDPESLVHRCGQHPVMTAGRRAGYPLEPGAALTETPFPADNAGLELAERRAVSALTELLTEAGSREPRAVALWGPPGSGKTTAVCGLARVARLAGYVPVSTRLLDARLASALAGRSVLLIDDGAGGAWRRLLELVICSPRAHVLVMTSSEDLEHVASIGLDRLSTATLASAVRPPALGLERRIRRAAERADGVPGRLVDLLWSGRTVQYEAIRPALVRVAERTPDYVLEGVVGTPAPLPRKAGPASDDRATLHGRMRSAVAALATGRHAWGERVLREAIGGLSRRQDWPGAAEGSVALAGSLLRRGRVDDARRTVHWAREYFARAGLNGRLADVAALCAHAWIDDGRLDEAESVARTAALAATGTRDREAHGQAALALARCLYWQGRFAEAAEILPSCGDVRRDERCATAALSLRARIAVGRHDLAQAVSAAGEAVAGARSSGQAALVAEASCAAAFVRLALGDADGLARDAAACLEASRRARDPLRAVRARLLLAEQARRAGRQAEASAVVERIRRLPAARLSAIVRARLDLVSDLLSPGAVAGDVVDRRAAATGLQALRLFLPIEQHAASRVPGVDVGDLLEILGLCQSAGEEAAALGAVTGQLQQRLRAAAAGFFSVVRGQCVAIAGGSARLDSQVATRAIVSHVAIAPHQVDGRLQAAVPVRYGGTIVGALAARWSLGSTPDPARVTSMLMVAAAAAAPLLAAAARQEPPAAVDGLVGTSGAMTEVRRAVERAAGAPFAALIEGESGSGKELVARAIHRLGPRRDRPFCTLNCAALPDDLVESELFGHARGAFTGAVTERPGVFEDAHGGTLFLDEVGELSPRAQAKLLRVIQEGELRRIGENVSRRIDVRIVSATNRDLRQEAAGGRFRLDLLYRLDVIRIAVPPLRERREDIPLLAHHLWRDAAARLGSRATLAADTVAALSRYDWPGNVRELQNVLAALVVRSGRRGTVPPSALPPQFVQGPADRSLRLAQARRTFDERFIRAALVRTGGRRAQAAAELGVSRQGLTKLMARLGIAP